MVAKQPIAACTYHTPPSPPLPDPFLHHQASGSIFIPPRWNAGLLQTLHPSVLHQVSPQGFRLHVDFPKFT